MLKILGNRLLLRKPANPLTEPQPMQHSAGSSFGGKIIIPERFLDPKVAEFEVVALGEHKDMPPELAVGQHVLMNTKMGHQAVDGGQRIMSTLDVFAIIEQVP